MRLVTAEYTVEGTVEEVLQFVKGFEQQDTYILSDDSACLSQFRAEAILNKMMKGEV